MSFFGELGLKAAQQLEDSVGPFVALASYKRLFVGEPAVRDAAHLGALRCAVRLDDAVEIQALTSDWAERRLSPEPCHSLVAQLHLRGQHNAALSLATAENKRAPSAVSAYLTAYLVDQTGGLGDYRRALRESTQDHQLGAFAAARQIQSQFRGARTAGGSVDRPELFTLAQSALEHESAGRLVLPAALRVYVLRSLLLSPNAYARAGALSDLAALADPRQATLSRQVVAIAICHFDELGPRLAAVEFDRLGACFRLEADPERKRQLLAVLTACIRQATARKRAAQMDQPEPSSLGFVPQSVSKDESTLRAMASRMSPDNPCSFAEWSCAIGLAKQGTSQQRAAARELLGAALTRTLSVPPIAFSELALLLQQDAALMRVALRCGALWGETRASEMLGQVVRAEGYQALACGDRSLAQQKLREARSLMTDKTPE